MRFKLLYVLTAFSVSLYAQRSFVEWDAGSHYAWLSSDNIYIGMGKSTPGVVSAVSYHYNYQSSYYVSAGMSAGYFSAAIRSFSDTLHTSYFSSGAADAQTFGYRLGYVALPLTVYFNTDPIKDYISAIGGLGIQLSFPFYSEMHVIYADEQIFQTKNIVSRPLFEYYFQFGVRTYVSRKTLLLLKIRYTKGINSFEKVNSLDLHSNRVALIIGVAYVNKVR